jgi:hypothetical protein
LFKKIIKLYNENDIRKIIGIDFEFEKVSKENKNVSLIQINYENSSNIGHIFVFNPNTLNKKQINILIKFICSRRIIKIIHGGESLDIPYLLDNLFNKNNSIIKKFLKNLIDTKFICQHLNLSKCGIYDLLLNFGVINKTTFNDLNNLNDDIGPIHEITLNIETINKNKKYEEYVINDVIYLPLLYYQIKKKLDNELNIIKELTNISYLIKHNIISYFNDIYIKINEMNNYFIIINKNKMKLIDIFYYYYYYDKPLLLKYNNVTYFNQFIQTAIKYMVYKNISNNYIIYKSNKVITNNKISFNKILLKFPNIKELFLLKN